MVLGCMLSVYQHHQRRRGEGRSQAALDPDAVPAEVLHPHHAVLQELRRPSWGLHVFISREGYGFWGGDGGFIPVGPGRSLAESGPEEGCGLGHQPRAVPGASLQQSSAAAEEVLGPEGEAGQRGQVSMASCGRRARVQGLDLNPGRFQ